MTNLRAVKILLAAVYLLTDGDGSDPHGESLLGNGASSQDGGDTVISSSGTPTRKEDL